MTLSNQTFSLSRAFQHKRARFNYINEKDGIMLFRRPKRFCGINAKSARLGFYWTLGRYDTVLITEEKDEKAAMKTAIRFGDMISQETLVAVPREEAIKLVE